MNIQSLGHAAGIYQKRPEVIEAAIAVIQCNDAASTGERASSDARPAMTMNGIKYFHAAEVARAIDWLNEATR